MDLTAMCVCGCRRGQHSSKRCCGCRRCQTFRGVSLAQHLLLVRLRNAHETFVGGEESPFGMGKNSGRAASSWHRTVETLQKRGYVVRERYGDHFKAFLAPEFLAAEKATEARLPAVDATGEVLGTPHALEFSSEELLALVRNNYGPARESAVAKIDAELARRAS